MDTMAAIVLAGGGARRLGGVTKPAIEVGGVRMIDRVIAALHGASPIVVVGPESLSVPLYVIRVQEQPPGGGPVAGIGAAIDEPSIRRASLVAIIAGDLPLLTAPDMARLASALDVVEIVADRTGNAPEADGQPDADGAVYVDATGRRQWLCGIWRMRVLDMRLRDFAAENGGLANGSLRALFGSLRFVEVHAGQEDLPPFFDCDTDDDIRRVEERLRP